MLSLLGAMVPSSLVRKKPGWFKLGVWVSRKITMPLAGLRFSAEESFYSVRALEEGNGGENRYESYLYTFKPDNRQDLLGREQVEKRNRTLEKD